MRTAPFLLSAVFSALVAAPVHAQIVDDFQTGLDGWRQGLLTTPLTTQPDLGEMGIGDSVLAVPVTTSGAYSRLAILHRGDARTEDWVGDWTGRDAVHFRVLNTSGVTLTLRVGIQGSLVEYWVTSASVDVPSQGGWQDVTLDTRQSAFVPAGDQPMSIDLPGTYAAVTEFRIMHAPAPNWRGVAPTPGVAQLYHFDDISDAPLPGFCGNGSVDVSGEACDGLDLDGMDCDDLAFDGGTLGCSTGCSFDTSGCTTCGNGVTEAGETCDTTDVPETCIGRGFDGGILGCNAGCDGFDEGACTTCGDNTREGAEVCDGTDLAGQDCASQGLGSGTLACNASCSAFNASGCSSCGNSVVDSGEVCDGANLDSETCESQGFSGGALGCDGCAAFDTSACESCGDDTINGTETCDGTDLGGASCTSVGFDEGTLGCAGDCAALDTDGCSSCGDGMCTGEETIASCAADCSLLDTFQEGVTEGWRVGSSGPQPMVVANQGPTGTSDDALVVTPSGMQNRLVVFNNTRWAGDYAAIGRDRIYAHVRLSGTTPVSLRAAIDGAGGRFVTDAVISLSSGGFMIAEFSLATSDLVADGGTDVNATLAAVSTLRIMHAVSPTFIGETTSSILTLDNISDQPLTPICGDGAVNGSDETCDDGGVAGDDGCGPACQAESCGDGFVQLSRGEECDDGAANSNSAADACRLDCTLPSCGDLVVDTGEVCDTLTSEMCSGLGFAGGLLRCMADCQGFDTGGCIAVADMGVEQDAGTPDAGTVGGPAGSSCALRAPTGRPPAWALLLIVGWAGLRRARRSC